MPRKIAAFYLCYQIWLAIKNDYRTLVGLDELSLIEKEDTQDEDADNV